jgi:signal peptidase I
MHDPDVDVPEFPTPAAQSAPETKAQRNSALRLLRDVIAAILIAVFVIVFVYRPVKVEGTSMMPTLSDEERIFINQFTYRFGIGDIHRGDMVVFWYPLDRSKSYIKRIIGLPGETVEIDNGQVYVNNRPLDEPYLPADYRDVSSMVPRKLGPEEYFVLGDHRSSSNDSRVWGAVDKDLIFGRAVFAYWPMDKMGSIH